MCDNRDVFRRLLNLNQISQAKAAELICIQTQRPCSVRAVRSWVNDPDSQSSRSCPDWAVVALRKALKLPDIESARLKNLPIGKSDTNKKFTN